MYSFCMDFGPSHTLILYMPSESAIVIILVFPSLQRKYIYLHLLFISASVGLSLSCWLWIYCWVIYGPKILLLSSRGQLMYRCTHSISWSENHGANLLGELFVAVNDYDIVIVSTTVNIVMLNEHVVY
jgi:hypothetical protein